MLLLRASASQTSDISRIVRVVERILNKFLLSVSSSYEMKNKSIFKNEGELVALTTTWSKRGVQ